MNTIDGRNARQRWFRTCFCETLRGSGKYRQVQEASTAAAGDCLGRGKLYELEKIGNPGIRTKVSLQLVLLDHKTGMVVWSHRYDRDESVEACCNQSWPNRPASLRRSRNPFQVRVRGGLR
jgi:hypothetical protein